jgi:hypothetical protein
MEKGNTLRAAEQIFQFRIVMSKENEEASQE